MAQIQVVPKRGTAAHIRGVESLVFAWAPGEVYSIACNGDSRGHNCPPDLEPGDTWSNLGDCVAHALVHIELHERAS